MEKLQAKMHGVLIDIEVNEEKRPRQPPWGSLIVNGRHVYRFDTAFAAQTAAHQLFHSLNRDEDLANYRDAKEPELGNSQGITLHGAGCDSRKVVRAGAKKIK